MKKFMALAAFIAIPAFAQELYVVSVQPKIVTIQQQQCQQVQIRNDNSGVGTVIGGVAGGIIGNQVGRGSGRDAATVAGAIVGGMVGNRIGQDQAEYQIQTQCHMVPVQVQRGEIVTFNYRGRIFTQTFD
jgi:uncharacterized protein YcfJ